MKHCRRKLKKIILWAVLTTVLCTGYSNVTVADAVAEKTITGLGTGTIENPTPGSDNSTSWVGDQVYFGSKEDPILFNVLQVNETHFGGNTILLDCASILEEQSFDGATNEWALSDVKTWLNENLCSEVIEKSALDENPFVRDTRSESDSQKQATSMQRKKEQRITPDNGSVGSVPDPEYLKSLVETGKAYYSGTAQIGYDRDKAKEYFQEAAQAGNGEAWYYLGNLEMNSIDLDQYEQVMEYYTKAYECGYGPGLVGQAMLYEDGLGVEQDFAKAFELYTQATKEGYVEGYCGLGNLYWHGNGVLPDEKVALEYYKMAVESEDYIWRNFAKCQIAKMYKAGNPGIGLDYSAAYDWYTQAANEGYGSGFLGIGNMYYSGDGIDKDRQEAFEWYKRAAAHGNPTGMYIVGFMLEYGQGVSQDYEQALKYYLQAANLGDEDAMYRAGMIYANLDGEYGNTSIPEEAEYWLSLALRFTDDQELTDSISKILPYVTLG